MKRDGLKRGMVTLCIGGGLGIALALESLNRRLAEKPVSSRTGRVDAPK